MYVDFDNAEWHTGSFLWNHFWNRYTNCSILVDKALLLFFVVILDKSHVFDRKNGCVVFYIILVSPQAYWICV